MLKYGLDLLNQYNYLEFKAFKKWTIVKKIIILLPLEDGVEVQKGIPYIRNHSKHVTRNNNERESVFSPLELDCTNLPH